MLIRSPFDQSPIADVPLASRAELDQVIARAARSMEHTRRLSTADRSRILQRVSDGIGGDKEGFAHTIALEAGKPIRAARIEVERAIMTFALAAEEAGALKSEHIPIPLPPGTPPRRGTVARFPAGVVAAITPFNFPLNLVAHKLAPAIAVGCPVVLKPAPQTPFSSLNLAKLVHDSGWPADALAVTYLSNEDAPALVEDDRLAVLSFTGSAKVGWELKSRAGKKRVLLELGGNAAAIVHEDFARIDAELDDAVTRCVAGGYTYAGQSCISIQRIFAHRSIFDRFLERFVAGVKRLKSGDPLDENTDLGPLIRESDAVRVEQWIAESVADGARLLCGGERKGSFLSPAVLTGTKPAHKVNAEEVFGPLVTVEPYDDFPEALALTNASRYGLQAGIFTRDPALIELAFRELEVGGIIVNDAPTFRSDAMPYGGVKDSGLGREGVRHAMREMSELKVLVEF